MASSEISVHKIAEKINQVKKAIFNCKEYETNLNSNLKVTQDQIKQTMKQHADALISSGKWLSSHAENIFHSKKDKLSMKCHELESVLDLNECLKQAIFDGKSHDEINKIVCDILKKADSACENISDGSIIFEADDKKMEDFIFQFGSINDKSNFVGSFSTEGFDMLSDDDEIYEFNDQLQHQRFFGFQKSLEMSQLESQSNKQVIASKEELGFKNNDSKDHLFPSGESIEQWLKPTDKKKVNSTSLQSLKNEETKKWFSNYYQDKNDALYQKKKESFKQSNVFAANKKNDEWLKTSINVTSSAGKKLLASFIDNCSNIQNADYSLYLCNARFKKAQPKRPNLFELYRHEGQKNNADKKSKFTSSTALSQMDDILQRSSDFYLIHKTVKAPEARHNFFAVNQSTGSFVDHCNDIINSHSNRYLRVIPAIEQHSYPIHFLQHNFYLPSKTHKKFNVHSVLSPLEEVLSVENHLYLKPVRKTKSEAGFLKNKWLVNYD